MRILFICKSLPYSFQGGIQTHVWELSKAMLKRGHDVTILTGGSWKGGIRHKNFGGLHVVEVPYFPGRYLPFISRFAEELSFNLSARKWLRKHKEEFDIFHLQGRSGFLFAGEQGTTPLVTTLHGLMKVENGFNTNRSTGRLDHFLHERWASKNELKELENSDALIAVSNIMCEEIGEVSDALQHKTHQIYNGVTMADNEVYTEPDPNLLVFVGRIRSIKGIFPMVEAMKRVRENIRLVLVGGGPDRKKLQQQIDEGGLTDRVELAGAMPLDDVYTWLRRCYALILPSYHETQGIVLMEANCCFRPVLASNIPGIDEVVEEGVNGRLFEVGNVEQMAESINELFANPAEAKRMGMDGCKLVHEKFNWDHIAAQTIELYNEIISIKQAAGKPIGHGSIQPSLT